MRLQHLMPLFHSKSKQKINCKSGDWDTNLLHAVLSKFSILAVYLIFHIFYFCYGR
jgi:hypothetical protein